MKTVLSIAGVVFLVVIVSLAIYCNVRQNGLDREQIRLWALSQGHTVSNVEQCVIYKGPYTGSPNRVYRAKIDGKTYYFHYWFYNADFECGESR